MGLNTISYPHPVLGNGDDISNNVMEPEVEYTITDEAIRLSASRLLTGHTGIDELVSSNYAQWQIRVQCNRTYMRANFLTSGPDWCHHLAGPDFEGTVDVETQVIAVRSIDDYSPDGAHSDYSSECFQIKPGELLAVGPAFRFHVDKNYDILKAPVSSLLQVREGDHEHGPFKVLLEDRLIFVELSKRDWQEYAGIRDRVPTILHSAVVLPVLAKAISDIGDYSDTIWANRLQEIIERRDIDTENPLNAAQELLDCPLKRTFDQVNAMLDRGV